MISRETVRKMLERQDCDGVRCADCPVDKIQQEESPLHKWTRCCERNDEDEIFAVQGRKFRPRVIRLLTEWLAEQEKKDPTK